MELSTLILIIITACISLYYFILSKLSHFKQLKIPHVRPIPLLGHLTPFVFRRLTLEENIRKIYNVFPDVKYFGFYEFMTPVYVIRDPDLITTIAIKNFDNFCNHNNFLTETDPLLSRNLFNLKGDHWREMRKLISPTFTSGKIKIMFKLMCECAENLVDFLANDSGNIGKTYDMKNLLGRYANDVVATCAFGISVDSFKHPNNDFLLLAKEAANFTANPVKFLIIKNFPLLGRLLGLKIFSSRVSSFFKEIIADTVKTRDEQKIIRPDVIHLMMEKRDNDHGLIIDIDEMTAQAFIFLVAGLSSTSITMSFLTYEIGINFDVQNKLRAEIDDVLARTDGKPTYEAISQMKYLDAVINETLRLYPLGGFIDRICVKEFELPPATPDGEPITLKPGNSVWFPHYALHRDPKYYSQPDKFDPDRFLNDEVDNSVYMPFGIGPRICIANRFALIKLKVMLFYLLWRCDLEPDTDKTKIPIVLSKKVFVMQPEDGFWLKLRMRKLKAPVTSLSKESVCDD
ncbi:cytochrome P450 9e2-like [Cataglyphis hispanica]|uniref:cytochrome P450 9e2-like n=1 Tax=Cataglyphis hispanica TaxID=1086592 RepID=UPI00217F76CC|nr:cytochrome P450 9e2-like [Cataglyphis hispanica]